MFKIRYKSHHDVGNVISKFTKNFKASKEDFISLLEGVNVSKQLALYFHTPYCDKICSFCNMNRKQLDNDLEEYTKYICDEIKKYEDLNLLAYDSPNKLNKTEYIVIERGAFAATTFFYHERHNLFLMKKKESYSHKI